MLCLSHGVPVERLAVDGSLLLDLLEIERCTLPSWLGHDRFLKIRIGLARSGLPTLKPEINTEKIKQ